MSLAAGVGVREYNTVEPSVTAAVNAVADGAFNNSADKLSVVQLTDVNGCAIGNIELRVTFNGAGTMVTNPSVSFYARLKSRDGSSWESVPDANNKRHRLATIAVDPDNITTEQILKAQSVPIPEKDDFEIWWENNTGVTTATGWDLVFVAYGFKASA